MSEPSSTPGLFASLRQLLSTTLEIAQVRLALLGTEFEREKLRIFDAVLWLGLSMLFLGVGVLLVSGFLVVLLWDSHRLATLGVLAGLFLGGGIGLLLMARQRLQSRGGMLESSLSELERDRAHLDVVK